MNSHARAVRFNNNEIKKNRLHRAISACVILYDRVLPKTRQPIYKKRIKQSSVWCSTQPDNGVDLLLLLYYHRNLRTPINQNHNHFYNIDILY